MKEYLLDTNFILRFILNDNFEQVKIIRDYFTQAKNREITLNVPLLVVPEVLFALTRFNNIKKEKATKFLFEFINLPYLNVNFREILNQVFPKYMKMNLSFVDLFLYFQAKSEGIELLTFDEKLRKLKI